MLFSFFRKCGKNKTKNINGWIELLRCLYKAELWEDALEYAIFAYEQTEHKPVSLLQGCYFTGIRQIKKALLYLEDGMQRNPKLVKK